MAYQTLITSNPEQFLDRLKNIESDLATKETINMGGTHRYVGEFVPATFTTGTDTSGVATSVFVGELRIFGNILITGISFLLGATTSNNTCIVILYNSAGVVLANSAVAGTSTGSTANVFLRVPFVTAYPASSGLYYVGVIYSGGTDTLRLQVAGNHNCGAVTSQTYGVPSTIVPPTTFTTNTSPIALTY